MAHVSYILDFSRAVPIPPEVHNLLWSSDSGVANGIEVHAKPSDPPPPIPFDAVVSIEGNEIVVSGGCEGHGYGSCVVRIPKHKFHPNSTSEGWESYPYYFVITRYDEDFEAVELFSQFLAELISLGIKLIPVPGGNIFRYLHDQSA